MENYRTGSHSRFDLKYHFVWITKYRKPILVGEVGMRLRELVREVCRTNEIEILEGAVSRDHVHVLLSCPPNLSPSKIMQYIKGKSSRKLLMEFKHLAKSVLGPALVGTRLLRGIQRQRDRRSDPGIHPPARGHRAR